MPMNGASGGMPGGMNGIPGSAPQLEIRQDEEGNVVGGMRVLGPINDGRVPNPNDMGNQVVPVLPKVQRNSASRLPFLMEM